MRRLRVALIGVGAMGKKYARMIEEDARLPMVLTAVCCRSRQTQEWARTHLDSAVRICETADQLYEEPDRFDAVLIATPHRTHPQLTAQALAHGKHVLCDKPAGISLARCGEMVKQARQSQEVFAMMFHQRMYPKYQRIHQILEDGTLGQICRVLMENSRYYRTARYHQSADWRSSWSGEGGGALMNQGQHLLDLWQWLFGMPQTVYAMIPFGKYNGFQVDDEATVLMEYPNRMTAVFLLTTGEGAWTERLEIVGTKGALTLERDTLQIRRFSQDLAVYGRSAGCNSREELREDCRTEQFEPATEPYPEMLRNFAEAVLEKTPLAVPGLEGMKALELTNAAYLSAWTGRRIALPVDGEEYERELRRREQEAFAKKE